MRLSIMTILIGIGLMAHSPSLAAEDEDPFADVKPQPQEDEIKNKSSFKQFFLENFGFRKELMSEFGIDANQSMASRQSIGFEVLKKFSTATRTFSAINFQGRLVRRDGYVGFLNDLEGMDRRGFFFEYHNAYVDFYNVLDPLLKASYQNALVGRFNFRIGRFYLPFGLNLQTDTHGLVLQLSNERNFGYERDWYAGLWGNLNQHLQYNLYYMMGSGYDPKYAGQAGLMGGRISLSNQYASEYGLEGGVAVMVGQRLSPDALARSIAVAQHASGNAHVDTLRFGVDVRYRHAVPTGLVTWTSELGGGWDAPDGVFNQLHELSYLHASRRFGACTQFRWFWQNMSKSRDIDPVLALKSIDASVLTEITWYFRNDVANSNLHWIKLNAETQMMRQKGGVNVIGTLQYYLYW